MKTAVLFAALAGTASAFVQQQNGVATSALSASFENELGVQPPLGYWDPLNLLYGADQKRFDRLRFVEIKHGRIAMLAIVGHMLTTAGKRFPGCEDFPSGLKALTAIPTNELVFSVACVGLLEFCVRDRVGKAEYPGDMRNGMFAWNLPEAEQKVKRSIELNNGRAAQMGILGLMMHEQMTGEPYILNEFLGYPTV